MVPISADSAANAQKQTRRMVPRIVPAIPLRLSRAPPAARPITPEESIRGTVVTPQEPESAPPVVGATSEQGMQEHGKQEREKEHSAEQRAAVVGESPLTPDSRISVADKHDEGAPAFVHSPPVSDAGPADDINNASRPMSSNAQPRLAVPTQLLPMPPAPDKNGTDLAHPPLHRHQLSAGAIEFRSTNDSPVVPSTPQHSRQDGYAAQAALPQPPPGFATPQYAPFFPAHAHQPADVGASWFAQPYPTILSDASKEIDEDVNFPQLPQVAGSLPTASNINLPEAGASFAANGTSALSSRSHGKPPSGDRLPNDHGAGQYATSYQNGTVPPAESFDESPFELAAYLSTQFGNPEFTDFVLQIRSPEFAPLSIPVHGIIIVRSPVIADAIRHSPASNHRPRDIRKMIDISVSDPFVTQESVEEAIKVIYGAPLLSAQNFLFGLGSYIYESAQVGPSGDAQRRMQQILSYIAAARTLRLPAMHTRGMEIARLLIRWDTVEQVLRYGLQPWSRVDGLPTEDPFVAALLDYAMEFMAYAFPVNFKLYPIAPELQGVPRLPPVTATRQPAHNPRLSKIRFGDASPEDYTQPNHANKVLSTILLSLPPPLIERIFNHRAIANQIGWTGAATIMRDVVHERESRRQKTLQTQPKVAHNGSIPALLTNNLYTEEHVEQVEPSPLHPSGYRLVAKHMTGET